MADIRIHTKIMPLFHAVIFIRGQRIILINFANDRTKVNGMPAEDVTYLFHGNIINFGDTEFIFQRAKTILLDLTNENEDSDIEIIDLTEEENQTNNSVKFTEHASTIDNLTYDNNNNTQKNA